MNIDKNRWICVCLLADTLREYFGDTHGYISQNGCGQSAGTFVSVSGLWNDFEIDFEIDFDLDKSAMKGVYGMEWNLCLIPLQFKFMNYRWPIKKASSNFNWILSTKRAN